MPHSIEFAAGNLGNSRKRTVRSKGPARAVRAIGAASLLLIVFALAASGLTAAQSRRLTLAFEQTCVDLDVGAVIQGECPLHGPASTVWDLQAAYHSRRSVHTVITHNPLSGAAIAHLQNASYEDVTAGTIEDVVFSEEVIDSPFDASRVILIRTERGAVFKLGNATEDDSGVSFDGERLTPAP